MSEPASEMQNAVSETFKKELRNLEQKSPWNRAAVGQKCSTAVSSSWESLPCYLSSLWEEMFAQKINYALLM